MRPSPRRRRIWACPGCPPRAGRRPRQREGWSEIDAKWSEQHRAPRTDGPDVPHPQPLLAAGRRSRQIAPRRYGSSAGPAARRRCSSLPLLVEVGSFTTTAMRSPGLQMPRAPRVHGHRDRDPRLGVRTRRRPGRPAQPCSGAWTPHTAGLVGFLLRLVTVATAVLIALRIAGLADGEPGRWRGRDGGHPRPGPAADHRPPDRRHGAAQRAPVPGRRPCALPGRTRWRAGSRAW